MAFWQNKEISTGKQQYLKEAMSQLLAELPVKGCHQQHGFGDSVTSYVSISGNKLTIDASLDPDEANIALFKKIMLETLEKPSAMEEKLHYGGLSAVREHLEFEPTIQERLAMQIPTECALSVSYKITPLLEKKLGISDARVCEWGR
jgi:hypothetical protein